MHSCTCQNPTPTHTHTYTLTPPSPFSGWRLGSLERDRQSPEPVNHPQHAAALLAIISAVSRGADTVGHRFSPAPTSPPTPSNRREGRKEEEREGRKERKRKKWKEPGSSFFFSLSLPHSPPPPPPPILSSTLDLNPTRHLGESNIHQLFA